jgi:tetratricopeptide (TPR) repeat protein
MDFNEYVGKAIKFYEEGKNDLALENFEAALNLQPDNADIKGLVENLKLQANANSQADQACVNQAKGIAEFTGITDVEKTIKVCTQALDNDSDNDSARDTLTNAYMIRGLLFESKKEYASAINDYNKIISYRPSYAFIFDRRGGAYHKAGNYTQAIEDFKLLVQLYPDENKLPDMLKEYAPKKRLTDAYKQRGSEFNKKHDYARAIADYEKALEINPGDNSTREMINMIKANM